MKKYYTPEIEEFHVGFEIEHKNPMQENIWKKEIVDSDMWGIAYSTYEETPEDFSNEIRVKYLDKEDIESLGWKSKETNSVYFTKDNYRLVHWITNNKTKRDISIYKKYNDGTQEECLIKKCVIKNKSELKKLLKQLNIK